MSPWKVGESKADVRNGVDSGLAPLGWLADWRLWILEAEKKTRPIWDAQTTPLEAIR